MIVTRATGADLDAVYELLLAATRRLHRGGIHQWPGEPHFTRSRIAPLIEAGDTYLAWDGGTPVATMTVRSGGDPEFWTPAELAEPASYLSKAARADGWQGAGEALMSWAINAAHERGDRWVRLDAWRANAGLQRYYAGRGWDHVRTEVREHRNSGALFQRLALSTSHPFTLAPELPARAKIAWRYSALPIGAEVLTANWQRGIVTEVLNPGSDREVVPADWEYGTGRPAVSYRVKLEDGSEHILSEGDVTEASAVASAAHV
jgi:GNAT superfamily N-acetyltransferase